MRGCPKHSAEMLVFFVSLVLLLICVGKLAAMVNLIYRIG